MSDTITIARPYAKAIFEHALDSGKLGLWSEILKGLSYIALSDSGKDFISNPATTAEQQIVLFSESLKKVTGTESMALINLVSPLAHNKRLAVLPEINLLFEAMRAEQEKTVTVNVTSFSKLSTAQQQHLISSLSQRLNREVSLEIVIDKSLLGGAVIQAGDLVIDGSVRGKLNKLGAGLAA